MGKGCAFSSTALLVTLLAAAPLWADEHEHPRVTAQLVADAEEASPGSTMRLGVRLDIEEGWHVYWRYPGGAGLATEVDFELPDGFVAGELEWPLPIAFTQSEGIPGYGYEDAVVLAAPVEVPRGAAAQTAQVRAEVSWLACKGVCVLGSAEVEGSLSGLTVDPVFRNWDQHLPRPLDENEARFSMSTTGGLADGAIALWLKWRGSPQKVEWFPDPSEALEVKNVAIQSRGGLTRINAEVRQRKGVSGSVESLPSLLVVTDSDGARRGWTISTVSINSTEQGRSR
jgi:hypothetical protein